MSQDQGHPAFGDLRARHESVIDEDVTRLARHAGYLRERITGGRTASVGAYTKDMADTCQRILAAVAALETITETEKALNRGSQ